MKQFNLDEYLKNPSKRVVTREGNPVRIVCTNMKGLYPIVGIVSDLYDANKENAISYTENGSHILNWESRRDLFFASEKHEDLVNIFESVDDGHRYVGHDCIFESKEKAEKYGKTCSNYITTIKIKGEE